MPDSDDDVENGEEGWDDWQDDAPFLATTKYAYF
jgi:hypothetical protein